MNILFLYGSPIEPTKGGVQRVTSILSKSFHSTGFGIFYLSLKRSTTNIPDQYYLPDETKFQTRENQQYFIKFLKENYIDIIINQGALGIECSELAYTGNSIGVKIISVIHNSPLASIKNYSSSKYGQYKRFKVEFLLPITNHKLIKRILLLLYRLKYSNHYKNLLKKSDKVILLSDTFKEEVSFFVSPSILQNVISIANPIAFDNFKNELIKKEKTLLFVGRINFGQKRVDLLLQVWEDLFRQFPKWNLRIVGDGPEMQKAKKICENKKLERVNFEGFKNPQYYYEKASILCLTSAYEGFGLVLAEAQSYGVVPIAFNSFSSITEIIENNRNGILIEPFKIKKYTEELTDLMRNPIKIEFLSQNAKANSQKFKIENISEKWLALFNELIPPDA